MKAAAGSKFFLGNSLALAVSAHGFAQRLGWSVTFHSRDYRGVNTLRLQPLSSTMTAKVYAHLADA